MKELIITDSNHYVPGVKKRGFYRIGVKNYTLIKRLVFSLFLIVAVASSCFYKMKPVDAQTIFSTVPGLKPPEEAVATAMEDIFIKTGVPGEDLTDRTAELLSNAVGIFPGSDRDKVLLALRRIAPEEVFALGEAALMTSALQNRFIGARLASFIGGSGDRVRTDFTSLNNHSDVLRFAGPVTETGNISGVHGRRLGTFINGSFSIGDFDKTSREAGFDFVNEGVTAGIDYQVLDNLLLGAAYGYSRSDIDFDSSGGNLDTILNKISIYGSYYISDRFYINGVTGFGWNDYDLDREVKYSVPDPATFFTTTSVVRQTMKSDFDGTQFSSSLGSGYNFNAGNFILGPYVRVSYVDVNIEGSTEKPDNPGNGSQLNFDFDSQDIHSFTSALGSQVLYPISTQWGVLVPQARAEWVHEYENDSRDIVARFVNDPSGTPIRFSSDNPDRNFFNFGIGLYAVFTPAVSAFFDYETILDENDITAHNILVGMRYEF